MRICVFCSSSNNIDQVYRQLAYHIGRTIAEKGHVLVYGGATGGLMDAVAEGAADYRGEICVILINLSQDDFVIKNGERICQMVISKHENASWEEVEILDETVRGAGGFGHTGKH